METSSYLNECIQQDCLEEVEAEEESSLKEREARLLAVINALGHLSLDSIENFICDNSSTVYLATIDESLRGDRLKEEVRTLKDALTYSKAELDFNRVLLAGEREKVKELELELKLLKEGSKLKNTSNRFTKTTDSTFSRRQFNTSSLSSTPVNGSGSSHPSHTTSSAIQQSATDKGIISPAADLSTPKAQQSTAAPTPTGRNQQPSSLPISKALAASNLNSRPTTSLISSSSTSELNTPIPTARPSSSTLVPPPAASTSKSIAGPSSLRSLVLQPLSNPDGHSARILNYSSLLKSYYELRRSVHNYRLGALQHVDQQSSNNHPSLDFDLPDFEDFDQTWAIDGSLKKRYDILRLKELEVRKIQSELRNWKDSLKVKTSVNTPTQGSDRKRSQGEVTLKQKEKVKENPFQAIFLPQDPRQTPVQNSSSSYPQLLSTTPRKGKREEKWLIEEISSTGKKQVTKQLIVSSPVKAQSSQEGSEISTRYDSSSSQQEQNQEELPKDTEWMPFPSSKQLSRSPVFSPDRINSSPTHTSPPPPLIRRRVKNQPTNSSPPKSSKSLIDKSLLISPEKRSGLFNNIAFSSPPPTMLPSSAQSTLTATVTSPRKLPTRRNSILPSREAISSTDESSTLNELRFFAMMGSPPPPAPNWKKLHEEEKIQREKETKEQDERRAKEVKLAERKRKAEEEKAEETASRKKGGKRRRIETDIVSPAIVGVKVDQKGKGKSPKLADSKRRIEINPERNNGKDYHYSEVVRNKEARQDMHAEACDCCTDYYKRELGDSDGKNGENKFLSDRHIAMQAKLQQQSRHRHLQRPNPDPPEYWQLGFPTTQVKARINEKANVLRSEMRDYQEAEAEQENGRYRFAPN